jgi:cold shock CspA family protein/energy-coupling factor transporter ATP-binding protein EcfA2
MSIIKTLGFFKLIYNGYGIIVDSETGEDCFYHKTDLQFSFVGNKKKYQALYVRFTKVKDPTKTDGWHAKEVELEPTTITDSDIKVSYESYFKSKNISLNTGNKREKKQIESTSVTASQKKQLEAAATNKYNKTEIKNDERLSGIVTEYNLTTGQGYLKDEFEIERSFEKKEIIGNSYLVTGTKVTFISSNFSNKYFAKKVQNINDETILDVRKMALYSNIKKQWRVDAMSENNDLFFYKLDEIDNVKNGDKCFVIGRKGTGKTAIARHIAGIKEHNVFCQVLSFKDYPFVELKDFAQNTLGYQSQFRNLWKYLIYASILDLMSQNESIDKGLLSILNQIFPKEFVARSISSKLNRLNLSEIKINILQAFELNVSTNPSVNYQQINISEKIDLLENIIFKYIDNSIYYVLFDDLDEDYSSKPLQEEYFNLTKGLFKSVMEIKNVFADKPTVMPIIFLREDIYNHPFMLDDNKNRWNEYRLTIIWNEQKIKQMLAYRISKSYDMSINTLPFESAWKILFDDSEIKTNAGPKDVYNYIVDNSYLRPRDFILFLRSCCERALDLKTNDLKSVLVASSKTFSNLLRTEIESEVKGRLYVITEIFNILSHMRKHVFLYTNFVRAFAEEISEDETPLSVLEVLEVLFNYSLIGNITPEGKKVFKYLNPHASFNKNEPIMIHKGISHSLQLF